MACYSCVWGIILWFLPTIVASLPIIVAFRAAHRCPHYAPTPNGFVFSTHEITSAAERQRNLEAAAYTLNTWEPWRKFGHTCAGNPDLFVDIPRYPPPSNAPKKIHGISKESVAIRRHYHPEEAPRKRA